MRSRSFAAVVAVAVVVASVVGCTSRSDDPIGVYFPTHPPSGEGNLAILTGELQLDQDCLIVVAMGDEYLPLWPEGWRFDHEQASLENSEGAVIGSLGETIALGGGERTHAQAAAVIGEDVPRRCRVGSYWLATGA